MQDINPWDDKGGARGSAFFLALSCKCPHCGRGALYQGLLNIREKCTYCAFPLVSIDVGDGAVAFIILLISAILLPTVLWIEFTFEPPIWIHIILWPPLVTIMSILAMRPVKAWFIYQAFRHHDRGRM